MNWYITKVVFAITREDNHVKNQFDEQLRLVIADDKEEAFLKARALGLNEEDCFYNEKSEKVKWEFVNVSEVIPLTSLGDGTEIYSRIHEADDGSSYMHFVHQKAIDIRLDACVPQ